MATYHDWQFLAFVQILWANVFSGLLPVVEVKANGCARAVPTLVTVHPVQSVLAPYRHSGRVVVRRGHVGRCHTVFWERGRFGGLRLLVSAPQDLIDKSAASACPATNVRHRVRLPRLGHLVQVF